MTRLILAAAAMIWAGSAIAGPATHQLDRSLGRGASPLPAYPDWSHTPTHRAPPPRVQTPRPRRVPVSWMPQPVPTSGTITLTQCDGGHVESHERQVRAAIARGQDVRIDGIIESACVLWLMMPPGRICTTAPATIMLHHVANIFTGAPMPTETRRVVSLYPAKLREIIRSRGGLGPRMMRISASDVVPLCLD